MTPREPSTPVKRGSRSPWIVVMAVFGATLVAIALFGLIGQDRGTTQVTRLRGESVVTDHNDQPAPSPATITPPAASAPAAPVPQSQAPAPAPELAPVAIRIPSIGVDSALVRLGLNPDNTLEVPSDFAVAGWYIYRPVPGEPGPSIIAGHVDSYTGPAVFFRLKELEPGANIEVERSDGSVAVFTVTAREQYDKDAFPTDKVYGPTSSPQLRVITCGGSFDWNTRHYNDNVVVFAELQSIR
jgi:sortase (surface protein transpeptidase)